MIRWLAPVLSRLFGPHPPMDAHLLEPIDDPISRDLAMAVEAHARANRADRMSYDRRVGAAIDECLRKLGREPEGKDRPDA